MREGTLVQWACVGQLFRPKGPQPTPFLFPLGRAWITIGPEVYVTAMPCHGLTVLVDLEWC